MKQWTCNFIITTYYFYDSKDRSQISLQSVEVKAPIPQRMIKHQCCQLRLKVSLKGKLILWAHNKKKIYMKSNCNSNIVASKLLNSAHIYPENWLFFPWAILIFFLCLLCWLVFIVFFFSIVPFLSCFWAIPQLTYSCFIANG